MNKQNYQAPTLEVVEIEIEDAVLNPSPVDNLLYTDDVESGYRQSF